VPGVSSAVAVPAYAGIPVTHRGVASSFAVVTGHEDEAKDEAAVDWARTCLGAPFFARRWLASATARSHSS